MSEQTFPLETRFVTCDGPGLKQLAAAGLAWLEQHHEAVNQLNVFPVPDGDTGTNMMLTMRAAYHEIAVNNAPDVSTIADRFAYGAIMGSRGNSGTILSQLLRGFAQSVSGKNDFDAATLAIGLRQAVKMAYKAVQTPVEGTILTVAREVAEEVESVVVETTDLKAILERAVTRARASVAYTPELLPILKKAGVVDSGGQGLTYILEGMLRYLNGELMTVDSVVTTNDSALANVLRSEDERGYGYDVQYLLRGKNLDIESVRAVIGAMGDSMVVVGDESLIKVHIHVHDPGIPISYGIHLGIISDVVVENMQEQSEDYIAMRTSDSTDLVEEPALTLNAGEIGVVAVAPGDGLRRVFRDLGVTSLVSGGQTMNPSTEELLLAAQSLPTDKVIILPNNKNVILAAEQAAQLANERGDRTVIVIPTKTVPQGITAMLSFTQDGKFESVVAAMQSARNNVVTGEVTIATRSVEMDGVTVESGQVIGLIDGKLTASGENVESVVHQLLDQLAENEPEVITMYYGDHVAEAEANTLAESLRGDYPDQEFDVIYGGQPHYQYILSAE
ncbi:MAG: DAK2 domain-containing protein [Chloroflexota bacterium]